MFVTNARAFIQSNDQFLESLMFLVREFVKNNFSVSVDEEFTTIRFFGFEYKMANIIRMELGLLAKFLYMIQGIASNFKDAFSIMRRTFTDEAILKTVIKNADERGGEVVHYGNVINELLQVVEILRRVANDITILTETGLIVGAGHRFTIRSAFKTFAKCGVTKAIPLVKALVDMNPREANRLNTLRDRPDTDEGLIFKWITENTHSSEQMLSRTRSLLQINELCTEQSLHITNLNVQQSNLEIDSLLVVDPKLLTRISPDKRRFYVNPKFRRLFKSTFPTHGRFLDQLWLNGTLLSPTPRDKFFEKLDTLEVALQRYPNSISLVVFFAAQMNSANFSQFAYHVLFALNNLERFVLETGLTHSEATDALHGDFASLVTHYKQCESKARELDLAGYVAFPDFTPQSDDRQLIEQVKQLASESKLRFGPVENATLHLDRNPMLRLGSEILKYNRFIANKCFDREEVQVVVEGLKSMIYLGNEDIKVLIGVVQGEGAYIDTVQFTLEN